MAGSGTDKSKPVTDLAGPVVILVEPQLGAGNTATALKHWQNIESASSVTPAFDALVVS